MTLTSYVQAVYPHARFPQRFVVDLPFGRRLYTMNPWRASLCERSIKVRRAVRLETQEGRFGTEIIDVALVPHEEAARE